MQLAWWQKSIQNKYSQLLAILMVMFVLAPVFRGITGSILISAVLLSTIIAIIRTFNLKKRFFLMLLILAGTAFGLNLYTALRPEVDKLFLVLIDVIYSLFIFSAFITINQKIFSQKKVNADTIKGGISVFFLIGIAWTLLYRIVNVLDPNAFSKPGEVIFDTLFYFSFTTLTTLGYGDITPVSNIARTLANLEAIAGLLYPSIFIARLVGLYTAQEMSEDD